MLIKNDFIDFVIDTNPNKYPENGAQGNYYYTKEKIAWIDSPSLTDSVMNLTSQYRDVKGSLPYLFYNGSAVVYNNEIHLLGGDDDDNLTNHYKYDGTSWTLVSTLPFSFYNGSAVVYNNEIHLLGGYSEKESHYKWNGTAWSQVSTLLTTFFWGSAVVYNNEIHLLGGAETYNTDQSVAYHYKYNGASWTKLNNLNHPYSRGAAVVYNNEIHLLGGKYGSTDAAKYDGVSWTDIGSLPYKFINGSAVVYNNEIHLLGGNGDTDSTFTSSYTKHFKYNGAIWSIEDSPLPFSYSDGAAVVFDNEMYLLNGTTSYIIKSKFYTEA